MRGGASLRVGGKLTLAFGLMIVLVVGIGAVGFVGSRLIYGNLTDIFAVRLPSIDYLVEADRDLQQLLVAERSMIFANTKSEVFEGLTAAYTENRDQARSRWEKYTALAATPVEQEHITAFEQAWQEWQAVSQRIVEGRVADTREGRREALDLTLGEAAVKFERMRDIIDTLTNINLELADQANATAARGYRRQNWLQVSITLVGLFAGLGLMLVLRRGITTPLREVMNGLLTTSAEVGAAAGSVTAASQQLADGSSQQAAAVEETSSSLEEMAAMTKQNAGNAGQADRLMQSANATVQKANASMQSLAVSMKAISQASEETQKIVKTIDEIAFQTNLLALNAAVEAARAGEAGAGFAVVADEVRNLAMRAAEAAKTTADLIEGTVKRVQEGSELVTRTDTEFRAVADSAVKVGELVSDIAAASSEQAQGIEQVNQAVTEIDRATQSNTASAEESAGASSQMSAQAEQMTIYVTKLEKLVGRAERKAPGRRAAAGSRHEDRRSVRPAAGHPAALPEEFTAAGRC